MMMKSISQLSVNVDMELEDADDLSVGCGIIMELSWTILKYI